MSESRSADKETAFLGPIRRANADTASGSTRRGICSKCQARETQYIMGYRAEFHLFIAGIAKQKNGPAVSLKGTGIEAIKYSIASKSLSHKRYMFILILPGGVAE